MKVQNLKFTKLAVSIMALFLMLSFAASTCFAQDSDGGKTPPSVTIQRNDPTGDFAVIPSSNAEEWVKSVSGVTVNGISYSKGYVTWNQRWNEYGIYGAYGWELKGITIGEGWGNDDTGVCIIHASGYEDLILILNKDSYTGFVHTAHTGGTATCQEQAVCEICGQSYGSLAAHTFTKYVSDNNAACTEDGTKTAVCDVCHTAKDTITDEGSAKGHTYDEGRVTKEPTTAQAGEKTYTCTVCGAVKTEEIPVIETQDPEDPSSPDDTKNPSVPEPPKTETSDDQLKPVQGSDHSKNPAATQKETSKTSPKTGDEAPYDVWLMLFIVSAAGIAGTLIYKKKLR